MKKKLNTWELSLGNSVRGFLVMILGGYNKTKTYLNIH